MSLPFLLLPNMHLPGINLTEKNPSSESKRRAGILTVNSELTFNPAPPQPFHQKIDHSVSKDRAEGSCRHLWPLILITEQMPVLLAWLQSRSSAQPAESSPHSGWFQNLGLQEQSHHQDPSAKQQGHLLCYREAVGGQTNVYRTAIYDGKSLVFRQSWVEILASPQTSCVILTELLNLSVSPCVNYLTH